MVLGVGVYGFLLGISFIVRASRQPVSDAGPLDRVVVTQAVDGNRLTSTQVRIVYREYVPPSGQASNTIVLLHGSPGRKEDFEREHVPGAVSLPEDEWSMVGILKQDLLSVIYCYSADCHLAARAAVAFAKAGYPVREMDGGFKAWRKHGFGQVRRQFLSNASA